MALGGGGHTSAMLMFILFLAISGLVIGALARLIVPGPQPMGILATILCGLAGSFLGGLIGRAIFGQNYAPGLIMSVLAAALIVWAVGGRRRRTYI